MQKKPLMVGKVEDMVHEADLWQLDVIVVGR